MKYLFITTICIVLYSCASIGTLSGGPEDKEAPVLLRTNLRQTEFNEKTIELEFDEYISLNQADQNIRLYPAHSTMTTSIVKKKVLIRFDSLLQKETTYFLHINKGIQDNNANNPFSYRAVFSGGLHTDTNWLAVMIPEFKLYKNLKIGINQSTGSDSFHSFQKDYVMEVKEEIIRFEGLKEKPWNIWLFTDENNDLKPDYYKPCNFLKAVKSDSLYVLNPEQWEEPFRVKRAQFDGKYYKLYYVHQVDYGQTIPGLLGNNTRDFIYYTADSAVLSAYQPINEHRTDSITQIQYRKELKNFVQESLRVIQNRNQYVLSAFVPQFYQSKLSEAPFIQIEKTFKNKPDTLFLNHSDGLNQDTFLLNGVLVEDARKLSFIEISIQDSSHRLFDLRILKSGKEIAYLSGIKNYRNYLTPGEYVVELFPLNTSRSFDPFSMQEKSSVIYRKALYLKASWEENLIIKP